jgi:hypothetical protein
MRKFDKLLPEQMTESEAACRLHVVLSKTPTLECLPVINKRKPSRRQIIGI